MCQDDEIVDVESSPIDGVFYDDELGGVEVIYYPDGLVSPSWHDLQHERYESLTDGSARFLGENES